MWWPWKRKEPAPAPPTLEQLLEQCRYSEAAKRMNMLDIHRFRRALEDEEERRLRAAGAKR